MKKFYSTLLATLCIAGSALAAGPAVNLSVNKQLQTGKPVAKTSRVVDVKQAEVAPAKAISTKTGMVKSMRKADSQNSIEGEWLFDLGDYYNGSSSIGSFQTVFEATIEDGYVSFDDPTGEELPFVASYDESSGVLTFSKELLGYTGQYYVFQEPFVYNYTTDDLDFQNIYGQYNAGAGTITFEPDNGIAWAGYSTQAGTTNRLGFFTIYDLEGAEKQAEWIEMEDGTFNENILYSLFTGTQNTTTAPITVLENPFTPGIYKVKNPFGVLYAALGFQSTSPDMVIDATNPENVLVEMQPSGISGGATDGAYYYFNEGWYSEEFDDELDPALICTLTTDSEGYTVITFPYHSFTVYAVTSSKFYFGSAYESILRFKNPNAETPDVPDPDEPGDDDNIIGSGNITAQPDMNGGEGEPDLADEETWDVTASYNAETKELTINNFLEVTSYEKFEPITFKLNFETPTSGTISAGPNQPAFIDEYMDNMVYYYRNVNPRDIGPFGTFQINPESANGVAAAAEGTNTVVLNVEPWGEFGDYYGYEFFVVAYYNTVVTLNIDIPEGDISTNNAIMMNPESVTIPYNKSKESGEGEINIALETTITDFTYGGFQFDIQLPSFINVAEMATPLNASLKYSTVTNVQEPLEGYTAYRVVLFPGDDESFNTTGNVVNINFTYLTEDVPTDDEGKPAPTKYTVPINKVIFSSVQGTDMYTILGSEGTLIIEDETIYTDSIEITDVTLTGGSLPEGEEVDSITQGEQLLITVEVDPETSSEPVEWEVTDSEGNVIEPCPVKEGENGTWILDSSSLEPGDYTLTATSGNASDTYDFTVRGVILGDSNDNGIVTVADVVTTANYIANNEAKEAILPIDRFDFPNANVILTPVDGEQVINAVDLTATIDIILGTWDDVREPANARRQTRSILTNDALSIEGFKVNGSAPFTVNVNLDNAYSYSALQAVVEIPAGMTVNSVVAGPRAAGHNLVYAITDSKVAVVLFSDSNAAFSEVEGSLFDLEVTATEECGALNISRIFAADARSNGYTLSFTGGQNETGTTGIDGISTDDADARYFTVDGIEVFNPVKGQILIRVRDGKATKVVF